MSQSTPAINSSNFLGNPCIFIAFLSLEKTIAVTCRKGRIAEYIREMDDLVENFGPGWGFGGVEQAMCFLCVFLFWWGPTYTFGFWGNSRFLDVLLGSIFKCGVLGIGMPSGKVFSIFPSLSLFAIIKIPDGLRTFQGCYILFGSVSVFPPFPATEDELETQRQEGSCYKCTILTFLDFWSAEAAEDQSTSCWLHILCPSFSAFFRGTE